MIICNCSSNKVKPVVGNENLLGKWKVIEQLSDPGDGSGTFNPIESNRTIQFFSDNKVTINGSLCHMSIDVGLNMSGIYEVLVVMPQILHLMVLYIRKDVSLQKPKSILTYQLVVI